MRKFFHRDYYYLSPIQALRVRLEVNQSIRLGIFRKIAKYINDGIDLQQAISDMSDEYLMNNKWSGPGLLLAEWNAAMVDAGEEFSSAISDWVTSTDVMMVRGGEEGGGLVTSLENVISANETQSEILGTIKAQMIYPIILSIVAFGMMFMAKVEMFPIFESMIPPDEWVGGPKDFRSLTLFFTGNIYLLGITTVLVVYLIKKSFTDLTGPVRKILDRYPPWSSYRQITSSLFLISLSSMMATGTAAYDSILSLRDESSRYVQEKLDYILDLMADGTDIGDAFDENFFDNETMMDIRLYTRGSVSQDAINSIAKSAIETTKKRVTLMLITLRNLMLLAVGGYMVWFVLSSQGVSSQLKASMGV